MTINSLEIEKYPKQAEINRLFTTFECLGPVPRTCFKEIGVSDDKSYSDDLESYLCEVDREIENFIIDGGRESIDQDLHEKASHKIAIMHPSKTGYSYQARLITRWIAFRVYEKALKHSQLESFNLFRNLSKQTNMRSAAGWFLEGYVHDWFLHGGEFSAEEIPIVGSMRTRFGFKAKRVEDGIPEYFTTPKSLLELVKNPKGRGINSAVLGQYFLPWSRNYPSVDGLLFFDMTTILFFQITLAERHNIKSPGVAELLKTLPKTIRNVYFIFVVPEDCAKHYVNAQDVPDSATISPGKVELEVKQFRLIFEEKSMQEVAARGYRGGHDASELEVFEYDSE